MTTLVLRYNKHQSSNWRKFSPQMGNLATEMRAARVRGAKLTWTTTVSQHFCTRGGIWGEKKLATPRDEDHANGTVCCDPDKIGTSPSRRGGGVRVHAFLIMFSFAFRSLDFIEAAY